MILLKFYITTGWLVVIGIAFLIWLIYYSELASQLKKAKEDVLKAKGEIYQHKQEAELEIKNKQLELHNWAVKEFEKFKTNELDGLKKQMNDHYFNAAGVALQEWKIENEARFRSDAIKRSASIQVGKITEHLLPFHADFPFNPKDCRFIGSPIDMLIFNGYADNDEEITIYFAEIKTGTAQLNPIQKKIKSCVLNNRVQWIELGPDNL